jgi:hypothetical protein
LEEIDGDDLRKKVSLRLKVLPRSRLLWRSMLSLVLTIALYVPGHAYAAPAGSITALAGQVRIQRASHPIAVSSGTLVEIGDQISTGPNSRATITLSDGTQFELSASSTMMLTQNQVGTNGRRVETRLDLFGGLLHSLVRFAPGNAPNYEVHTPNAVAAARGTQYDTGYVNGAVRKEHPGCKEFTDVSVFDGTVEVTNPQNPTAGSTILTQGHKTTVPCKLLLGATSLAATTTSSTAATAATTTTLSTTTIVTGAAVVGAGVIAGGVVGGVELSGGSNSTSTPTPSPTPPVTPSG